MNAETVPSPGERVHAASVVDDALDLGLLRRLPGLGPSPLTFTLSWASRRGGPPLDLDLGCLYLTDDHRRGALQTVREVGPGAGPSSGDSVGPWVLTDGRGQPLAELVGDHPGHGGPADAGTGETLIVHQPRRFRFLLVSVSIYGGSGDFTDVAAELTARSETRVVATSRLASPPPNLRWCAVLALGLHGGTTRLVPEERYFRSAFHADRHYGFGLRWRVGVKRPLRPEAGPPSGSPPPNNRAR